MVKCSTCGLGYAQVVPTLDAIREYYDIQFSNTTHWLHEFPEARHWLYRRLLERIAKYRPTGQLVDVGCSFGFFMQMALKYGYDAIGIEISAPAVWYARERLKLNAIHGTLSDATLPSEFADIITFIDVLEHVPEPRADICEAHRILREGGLLVLRLPNFAFHWLKTCLLRISHRKGFIGLDSRNHVNHFPVCTLAHGLREIGFRVIEVRPGVPNIYRRWMFDAVRVAYWWVADGLRNIINWQIGNIIEVFAIKLH